MPRYVIERNFGLIDDDEMQELAARSKLVGIEQFPDIEWEHSHVCALRRLARTRVDDVGPVDIDGQLTEQAHPDHGPNLVPLDAALTPSRRAAATLAS
jgi:hypothetical protein